jgi:hypothetical protein
MLLSVVCTFNSTAVAQAFHSLAQIRNFDVEYSRHLGPRRRFFLWDQEEDPGTSGFEDENAVLSAFRKDLRSHFGAFSAFPYVEVLAN